jgi:hypothetical protein
LIRCLCFLLGSCLQCIAREGIYTSGDDWQQIALQNEQLAKGNVYGAINQGQGIASGINANIDNLGQQATNYNQQADTAYSDLAQTPGYTAQQAAGIEGNPNAAFQYYNPSGLTNTVNQGTGAVTGAASEYKNDVGNQVSQLKGGLAGNVSDLNSNLNAATSGLQSGVTGAADSAASGITGVGKDELGYQGGVYNYLQREGQQQTGQLAGGLDSAVGGYGKAINSAIDPSKLTVGSDFSNEYKLSPGEAQNIKDVASQTTAGQFHTMQDQAAIQAAAEGNTSPAALAAIKQNLGTSGAIAAGEAASNAELNANSVAAQRQLTNEQLTLGANQNLTNTQLGQAANLYGAQSGATQNEYAANAQQSQNLASQEMSGITSSAGTNLAGQEAAGGLRYTAANTAGQAGVNAANTEGQTAVGATEYGGSAGINATAGADAANIGAQQYGSTAGISANEYNQNAGENLATQANQAGVAGQTAVANQAIAGQGQVRSYLTGQQQQDQSLAAGYTNSAISNLGTTYNAANGAQSTANQATQTGANNQAANYATTSGLVSNIAGDLTKGFSSGGFKFADGGIVTKPTIGIIGERGPEKVVPLSGESARRRYRGPQSMAA